MSYPLEHMSDEELAQHAYNMWDPLTSSDLEHELRMRLDKWVDFDRVHCELVEWIGEYDVKHDEVRALVEAHPESVPTMAALLAKLADHDIHNPDQLAAVIDLADKFRALASDAGDVFERLLTLATTTQE